MKRSEMLRAIIHELWVQNLSHFGTLETAQYEKDAGYFLANLEKDYDFKWEPEIEEGKRQQGVTYEYLP